MAACVAFRSSRYSATKRACRSLRNISCLQALHSARRRGARPSLAAWTATQAWSLMGPIRAEGTTMPDGTTARRGPGTPQDVDRHVGRRIRERRVMLGLTQQQVAELVGVTYYYRVRNSTPYQATCGEAAGGNRRWRAGNR